MITASQAACLGPEVTVDLALQTAPALCHGLSGAARNGRTRRRQSQLTLAPWIVQWTALNLGLRCRRCTTPSLARPVLGEVLAAVPDAVLIGGWGTWVRSRGPMSHDIDLILARDQLAVLEVLIDDLSDSRHLAARKWRGTWRGVHLDLYVPWESKLGQRLGLRTEVLIDHSELVEGYNVLSVDAHIATKLAALLDRPASLPGFKDRQEIRAPLAAGGGRGTPAVLASSSDSGIVGGGQVLQRENAKNHL
jgi:hypothetical protein